VVNILGMRGCHPQDKAWSVNRLGCIARKHGAPDTCIRIINTMYGFNAMERQEAFTKIREQVGGLVCPDSVAPQVKPHQRMRVMVGQTSRHDGCGHDGSLPLCTHAADFHTVVVQARAFLDSPPERLAGLNLLNTTNLDYFQPAHLAEIFRLKGLFLDSLNEPEAANAAFSTVPPPAPLAPRSAPRPARIRLLPAVAES
jgi:transformation/transcription domain-associated protein